MNYIGSKQKLIPFLIEKITNNTTINSETTIFCDLFAGTGIVGKEFKKLGYYVISNDIQYYSYIVNKHYIGNNRFCEDTTKEIFEFLNSLPLIKGFVYENYCIHDDIKRNYFTEYNAMKCDTIRQGIENLFKRKEIEYPMYYFLIASLLKAIDNKANTTSTYSAYLKQLKPRAKKNMEFKPLEIVNGINGEVYNTDANKLINYISGDILYLDPPYNGRQYGTCYHLLETIAKYDEPSFRTEITGIREITFNSDYSLKEKAMIAFENLIHNANFKYIFLSYNNVGILSLNDIEKIMKKYGKYECFEKEYQKYKSVKFDIGNLKVIEYLHCLKKN